ncbi:MAG: DUF4367 domain-containing protein [Oscillospiraceae bacterium]|nr:DUF4367 domain-containing protein [Oscillospiraceae bacterium]
MNHLFKNPTFNGSSEQQGQEVSEMLEKELAKPYKKRDYDKIEELLNEYTRMNGMEEQIQKASETGVQKVIARTKTRKLRVRKYRPLITVVCLAVVMAIFNTISVAAFDMDAFSFIVHIIDDGFSVDFFSKKVPSELVVQIPNSEDDPYGMIAECEKNGLYPETPHYLPEGYVLILCDCLNMPKFCQGMKFTFKNQNNANESICFMYDLYESEEYITNAKFSNVEHDLREIEVNGKTAILAEEKKDKQFTIVYHIDNLLISIFTKNMPADEVYKIIESMR